MHPHFTFASGTPFPVVYNQTSGAPAEQLRMAGWINLGLMRRVIAFAHDARAAYENLSMNNDRIARSSRCC
jgi:hypothetical protein